MRVEIKVQKYQVIVFICDKFPVGFQSKDSKTYSELGITCTAEIGKMWHCSEELWFCVFVVKSNT